MKGKNVVIYNGTREELISDLCEGIHTGLRKGTNKGHEAWTAVNRLADTGEWRRVVEWFIWAMESNKSIEEIDAPENENKEDSWFRDAVVAAVKGKYAVVSSEADEGDDGPYFPHSGDGGTVTL